eukprot:124053-Chlamydomonas_euryale.AAC.4
MSNVQTLAESFLADLDELSDDDEPAQDEEEHAGDPDDVGDELDDIEALNYDDLPSVAKLSSSVRYKEIITVSLG